MIRQDEGCVDHIGNYPTLLYVLSDDDDENTHAEDADNKNAVKVLFSCYRKLAASAYPLVFIRISPLCQPPC